MYGFVPILLVGFALMSLVYALVSVWSRRVRRRKLEAWWEEEGRPGDRDAYVREGLEDYDTGFRRKLILLVYIVPLVVIGAIIYAVNYH
ncbi:hypothetical protein [Pseudooceanicola sp. LIPI14-2-Ac024]|uniref:hypothetical protein n=1 Tax=Pseudooceanicola sp. LIPI14-2-Ac024 TaxID=3344875 RepID=UPI0035D02091